LPALATGGKIGLGEVGEPESENGVTVRSQISAIGPHEGYKLGSAVRNSILSIVMGGTWMGGVAIYGMTVSKLERFGPSIGWALIQSEAIMAGNAMGLITGERRNTTNLFRCRMISGLLTLFGGIATVALSALG
jgi:hypothetical protein